MNAIANLKKAFQAQAVTKDTYSLQKFLAKFEQDGKARMNLVGIESKYVPRFDKGDDGSRGFRTRFILANGETVGTFSNGAHLFFQFYAQLMGYGGDEQFLHIDIDGNIQVDISEIALDQTRSTYNFELVEEGSVVKGFSEYLPTAANLLALDAPATEEETTLETIKTNNRVAAETESAPSNKKK